jgi:hypothetical protein
MSACVGGESEQHLQALHVKEGMPGFAVGRMSRKV